LLLAIECGCPLITGDKQLRSVAKKEKAEVYGTLWLVQRLLDEHLIDHQRAKDAYKAMKEDKRRLPWGKVDEQLKNYE
jgi:predicted nucleic acid-binding protein